jgi:hypothetical protein
MSRFISKKRALLTAAVTSLALVAVAIAYYSTTGDGTGTGGTTAAGYGDTLNITGDANAATLVPGGSVPISGNVSNDNGGAAKVGTVTGSVTNVDEVAGTCALSNFTIDTVSLTPGTVIAANDDATFTAVLHMADSTTVDQDAGKSAELDITWSSN